MTESAHLPTCCIVGSGIAGLSAAFTLQHSGRFSKVTIFEREKILGMDSQSVNTMIRGEEVRLDTPPRAFSEGFYPNLMSMYQLAGVEIEPFSWAWSVSTIGEKRAFLKMSGSTFMGFRIPQTNGTIWQSLFDSRTHNIIGDTLRFHREMKNIVNGKDVYLSKLTVGEFLKLGNYTDAFIYDALLPILSMICTCTYKSCKEYPIELAAGYFTRNSSYGQYHSKNGSQDVVRKLSAGCEIKTGVPVLGIWHGSASRRARVKYKENNQVIEEEFDVVVIASQAHTALNLISDITDEEREALSTFGFEYSTVSIHRDPALMPTDKRDWLPMNVILPKEKDQTMFTMWCSAASKHWEDKTQLAPLFQTWNPIIFPKKELEEKRITFERPVVTMNTLKGMKKLNDLQGKNGVYFCGAYALRAIPLQENGVACARLIAEKMGIECPWISITKDRIAKRNRKSTTTRKRGIMLAILGMLAINYFWLGEK